MEGHLLTQHPCSIFTHPRLPPLSQPPYRDAKPIKNPNLSSLFRCSFSTRYRPRDSNAETVGSSQKFSSKDEDVEDQDSEFGFGRSRGRNKKRRWWSDDNSSSPEMEEGPAGIFEQAIDTFWILKVAILVFTPFLSLRIGWLLGCFQFLLSYLFWSFLVTSFSLILCIRDYFFQSTNRHLSSQNVSVSVWAKVGTKILDVNGTAIIFLQDLATEMPYLCWKWACLLFVWFEVDFFLSWWRLPLLLDGICW